MNLAEIDSIVAASTKRCACCGERKPLQSFTPDASRHDGLARACRPCRAEQAREARAERAAPAPRPTGRGPERLEPGAILVALEELGAGDEPLVTLDCSMADVPRELRARAVRGVDGRVVIQRTVLRDWLLALRGRVGEHAMRSIGKGDLTRQQADSLDIARASRDRSTRYD